MKKEDTNSIIKRLEAMGYEVKKIVKTKRHTFELPEELLGEFLKIQSESKMLVKDALAEAIEDWIAKKKSI